MDWSNERYVRVYTRDTTTWKLMDWRGRCVLQLLMRKVDRAGVLDVGHDGVLGLAAVLELPIDIVEPGIAQLTTARGGMPTVVDTGTAYVLPNFIEAQEAPQSDPQRKRESRARRRDVAMATSRNLLLTAVAVADGHETGLDRAVESQEVTPIRSDPILPDQNLSLAGARAIPPTPVPSTTPAQSFAERDLTRLRDRGALAEATWQRLSELRITHAEKLRLPGVIGFAVIHPGNHPRGFRELLDRIREEGDRAHDVCDHVLRVLDQQATDEKSIEWLAEKAFLEGPWEKVRNTVLKPKRRPAERAPDPKPVTLTEADRAGAAEVLAGFLGKEPA